MNKLNLVKGAVSLIVGLGAGKIVNTIIDNNVDREKKTDKVIVGAGSLVLSAIVADAAKSWTDREIDRIVAMWQKAKNEQD